MVIQSVVGNLEESIQLTLFGMLDVFHHMFIAFFHLLYRGFSIYIESDIGSDRGPEKSYYIHKQ